MRVLLFSGGIDSAAIAWAEKPEALLFIDYGQLPAAGEQRAARSLANAIGLPLEERSAPLGKFGAGSLVGCPQTSGSEPEFWPFRNQMLITLAAMAFSHCDPLEILIGTVASDAVHPDGTAGFVEAMSAVLGAQGRVSVRAPAIELTGDELLVRSALPPELLGWTFSCHTGEWACGQCRGCTKHDALKALPTGVARANDYRPQRGDLERASRGMGAG